MSEIYVTGHQNPDMDSLCAASAYAYLKNIMDKKNHYIAARAGHMNANCKAFFETVSKEHVPIYLKDARIHASEIVDKNNAVIQYNEPIYNLVNLYSRSSPPTVVPVFKGGEFLSLLSLEEVAHWFLLGNVGRNRPEYVFTPDAWERILNGYFIKRSNKESYKAVLMVAQPNIKRMQQRVDKLNLKDKKIILIVGDAQQTFVDFAIKNNFCGIVFTTNSKIEKLNFDSFIGDVFISKTDTAETMRLLRLSVPVYQMLYQEYPRINGMASFDEARKMLQNSELRGLPVFDKDNNYIGAVTRRAFLERPQHKIIMVDHNESSQSLPGIEDAEIVEIIDHHRIDPEKTRKPIFILCEPVGSSCTVISELYRRWHIPLNKEIARILLAGIISDTVRLKSPTTTYQDEKTVKHLQKICNIDNLDTFAMSLVKNLKPLSEQKPRDTILSDFKKYSECGIDFGIGQCEVPDLEDAYTDEVNKWLVALDDYKTGSGLDCVMLLVTDTVSCNSILLTTNYSKLDNLTYKKIKECVFDASGVLSRKKQLLPEIIRIIEN